MLSAAEPFRGAEGGEPEILLQGKERWFGLEVYVIKRGVPLAREEARNPGVRVREAPDA